MSNQIRSFRCPQAMSDELISFTQKWLETQKFICQRLKAENGGTLLQIKKAGNWRKFVGMSTALNIVFHQFETTVDVEIGAGSWIDKVAAGTVSIIILWPLALTAGFGAWQQLKMPEKIFSYVALFSSEKVKID